MRSPKEVTKRQNGGKEIRSKAHMTEVIVVKLTDLEVPLVVPVGEARRNLRLPENIHQE